jgi:hypothetical protein
LAVVALPWLVAGWALAGAVNQGVPPLEQFRRAVERVELAPGDAYTDHFERVRRYAIEVARRARGSALAEQRALELLPPDGLDESAALGRLAGLHRAEELFKAASGLRAAVVTGECWNRETASTVGSEVAAAAWRAVARFDALAAQDATVAPLTTLERDSLARGIPALAAAIADGALPGPMAVPDASAIAAFEDRIVDQFRRRDAVLDAKVRQLGLAEMPRQFRAALGDIGWREEPSVLHAYLVALADDLGCRARAEAAFKAIDPLLEEINRGRAEAMKGEDWMAMMDALRAARRQAIDPPRRERARQRVEAMRAEQRRERLLEALLSVVAAAGRGTEALGGQHGPRSVDCALVVTMEAPPVEQGAALVPVVVERAREELRVSVGVPMVEAGSLETALDLAGATLVVPFDRAVPVAVLGVPRLAGPLEASIPQEWRDALTRVVEPTGTEPARTLGALRTECVFGGAVGTARLPGRILAAAWRTGDAPEERLRTVALAALARQWMSGGLEPDRARAAVAEIDDGGVRRLIDRLLCAELREQADGAKPGDPSVFDVLDLPADSPLRTAAWTARRDGGAPFLALAPETAALLAPWARERDREGVERTWDALAGAVGGGLVKTGLSEAEVASLLATAVGHLLKEGVAPSVVGERWVRGSLPLAMQASAAASLRETARAQALDGLNWMLAGAAVPQPLNTTARKQAWVRMLKGFEDGLRERACQGLSDSEPRNTIASEASRAFSTLFWWIASPGFPALNFDPDAAWLSRCAERALAEAGPVASSQPDGSAASGSADADLEARRAWVHAAMARLASVLLTEPDPPGAPSGHGAASMPPWAESYACTFSTDTGMLVTIARRAE